MKNSLLNPFETNFSFKNGYIRLLYMDIYNKIKTNFNKIHVIHVRNVIKVYKSYKEVI